MSAPIDSAQSEHPADLTVPQDRKLLPRLRSDIPIPIRHQNTLEEFRESEGRDKRRRMLKDLWQSLPEIPETPSKSQSTQSMTSIEISAEEAESLKATYDNELFLRCASPASGSRPRHIEWTAFKKYAEAKETGKVLIIVAKIPSPDTASNRIMAYLSQRIRS